MAISHPSNKFGICCSCLFLLDFASILVWLGKCTKMYQLSILRQCLSTRSSPFLKASCCDLSFCSICHLGHTSTSDRKKIWSFSSLSESLVRCNFLEAQKKLLNIHEHPHERKEPHWLFEWFIKISCMFHRFIKDPTPTITFPPLSTLSDPSYVAFQKLLATLP